MRSRGTIPLRLLAIAVVVVLGLPSMAHAYLDPGTGSYALQLLLAALLAGAYTVKLYWAKLRALLRRLRGKSASDSEPGADAAE
jgi:hypothetical protein